MGTVEALSDGMALVAFVLLARTPHDSRGRKWGRSEANHDATQLERSGAGPKGRGAGCTIKPGDGVGAA